jgi:hypothetical protein
MAAYCLTDVACIRNKYLLLSAMIYPKAIYPLYVLWMVIASILGLINTQILLAMVFYLVFAPIGCILRLTKGL